MPENPKFTSKLLPAPDLSDARRSIFSADRIASGGPQAQLAPQQARGACFLVTPPRSLKSATVLSNRAPNHRDTHVLGDSGHRDDVRVLPTRVPGRAREVGCGSTLASTGFPEDTAARSFVSQPEPCRCLLT